MWKGPHNLCKFRSGLMTPVQTVQVNQVTYTSILLEHPASHKITHLVAWTTRLPTLELTLPPVDMYDNQLGIKRQHVFQHTWYVQGCLRAPPPVP